MSAHIQSGGLRRPAAAGRGGRARALLLGLAGSAAVLTAPACTTDGEIEQPAPLYGEMPIEYPLQLWDQDMEGETLLRVRVTDTGSVDSVEVVESSGHPSFDSAAVSGARAMRFRPARRGGKRIKVWARVPVRFTKRPRPDTLGRLD